MTSSHHDQQPALPRASRPQLICRFVRQQHLHSWESVRLTLGVLVALSLLCNPSASLLAQQQVTLDQIDASRLALGTDSMEIWLIRDGDSTQIGQLWDELAMVEAPAASLQRVYRTTNALFGPVLDSVVTEWPTLAPRWQRTYSDLLSVALQFQDGRVTGWLETEQQGRVEINTEHDPTLPNAASFDLIVRVLPLSVSEEFVTRGYSASDDSLITLRATVIEIESVTTRSGATVQTWVIDEAYGELRSTMWVALPDRRLIRQEIHLAPGVTIMMMAF